MTQIRRDFLRHIAATGLASSAVTAQEAEPAKAAATPTTKADANITHDMHAFPPHWTGKEQIAMLLYPGYTALNLVGPHHMPASLMGAQAHLVAATKEPARQSWARLDCCAASGPSATGQRMTC